MSLGFGYFSTQIRKVRRGKVAHAVRPNVSLELEEGPQHLLLLQHLAFPIDGSSLALSALALLALALLALALLALALLFARFDVLLFLLRRGECARCE